MTASCLSTPCLSPAGFVPLASGRLSSRLRAVRSAGRGGAGALLAVAGLLLLAALLAPEQPMAQASICERHNGAAACRVW